ncbi:MAG: 50S ribosomal protein L19 [Candidatus Blackburnbacteria bacterium RIFCSPHIGHO2_01_FULL_44_64]|uniref:50S ribosomal protein L19 n=1 Tax=Candidatus Blackburnbacteria bacterium RIFCSPHIGHO2_02_FULL_44_20 TaxID=1797516 RepID=A0A1G1V485_9BACT|nr:MAG: 50S ribosomal protein L19 [Candidatus Blackburnbacteria bacterium RIFCSPHIGHO2_01_FULL_44_64]OGY10194.1 MAG: 50S ribosomal protein L19 [Candidatus Blackburnbacteria bacterium RIFCSPHIGHO2_02_FULL_44_20]OGY10351.1 MAG: 50S ribosomal protein L19 [Candidatus Blackburnbacteria bacterium RIFCSPHIGHO2_12_FULL_44_25]OGY15200.1 MAG: 50S ribosomal protein L19 [Candidatus Blackburnbacteria bacterium RIFCSPLOWO2_01_FULL_44_43]OGY15836.1 MAG: 50S ribosomal protein L19 [Candidatus Blackburnbacteria 
MALSVVHKDHSFSIGDTVRVHQKITESGPKGDRARIQFFDGLVIATRGHGDNKSFTVRRIGAGNIGIERIFPVNSPLIEKVDILSQGQVRRAKLYYLRDKSAREVAEVTKGYLRKRAAQLASAKKSGKKKTTVKSTSKKASPKKSSK